MRAANRTPIQTGFLLAWLTVLLCVAGLSPARAQDPEVDSADPPAAEQATFDLDVEVGGDNFGQDSEVSFFVTGTVNPGGITVKKVKVRGPKKLIATIDIAADATVDKFDIEVMSGGRRGKGTELFSVLEQGSGGGLENAGMLARVDFESGHAVAGDGLTVSCDGSVDHEYADSHDTCLPADPVKSDVSKNGGRWMFFSVYPLDVPEPTRGLKVDFGFDSTAGCEAVVDFLIGLGYEPAASLGSQFLLLARITADRAFKEGASRQSLDFRLPTVYYQGRWGRGLRIDYVNPLFLCDDSGDPEVRFLQTMGCAPGSGEDVSWAEVWDPNGSPAKKNWTLLGECSLPMKIRLERVPCTELCEGPA